MYYFVNNNSTNTSYSLNSTTTNNFMDKLKTKIVFAIIMGCLCFITTVGNICVIYRFRKASFVSIKLRFIF
jgi:hypothetical protein